MHIQYDSKSDLLYLRFDLLPATVINKRVSEDIVLCGMVNVHESKSAIE